MKTALTIAGSDSGGGAGIQADLKTFGAYGVFGTSAITAITAQNTLGVTAVHEIPVDVIIAQIEAVAGDLPPDVVKTGMLASVAIVEAIAAAVDALELPRLVVDPVMVAKSGHRLLTDEAVLALTRELLPRAFVVTPNVPEAEALCGGPVRTLDDMKAAATIIRGLGPSWVVMKGGHLPGDTVVDLLFDGSAFHSFESPRVAGPNTHGTGCTFASAIAAGLALGKTLPDAVDDARIYVAGAIAHGPAIGQGHRPLNHHWRQR